MTEAEPVFVDTNVLIYSTRAHSTHHAPACSLLAEREAAAGGMWISSQILREFLSAVTRPHPNAAAVPVHEAVRQARFFARRFWIAEDGPAVFDRLCRLLEDYPTSGRQVHDANIVATMLANGITRLLTLNVTDFRRFEGLIAIETA